MGVPKKTRKRHCGKKEAKTAKFVYQEKRIRRWGEGGNVFAEKVVKKKSPRTWGQEWWGPLAQSRKKQQGWKKKRVIGWTKRKTSANVRRTAEKISRKKPKRRERTWISKKTLGAGEGGG